MNGAAALPQPSLRTILSEVPPILRLAVPVIVGLISGTLMGVVDTLMIAPLGTDALAATGLATSALIIVHSGLFGLLSVVAVAMAQAHGAKDRQALAAHLTHGFVLAALASLAVAGAMVLAFPGFLLLMPSPRVLDALYPYWLAMAAMTVPYALFGALRGLYNAVNRPWIVVWIALAGVAANIPLNGLLIYAADLGLLGAGLASLAAKSVVLLLALWHWRRAPSMASYRQAARFRPSSMLHHVKEGVPVSLGSLGEGGAYATTGLMMALFGAAALAANQVVHSIGAIMYMVPMGMTAAVAIRMGQAVGANEPSRYRPVFLAANGVALTWAALVFTPLLVLRGDIAGALSADLAVVALAMPMFVAMAFIQFADGLQSIALGALRGRTDNRGPNAITITVYWAFALPLAYAVGVVLDFGPSGVLAGYAIGVLFAALILQARFWKRTQPV
ncbi:MATE family efflux transporter [Pelagibius sp.]|uniref:MATE family efflux transporter n=1 Tax=Pelagibius sp. TaxID=1931238 RepID=UPI003B508391